MALTLRYSRRYFDYSRFELLNKLKHCYYLGKTCFFFPLEFFIFSSLPEKLLLVTILV